MLIFLSLDVSLSILSCCLRHSIIHAQAQAGIGVHTAVFIERSVSKAIMRVKFLAVLLV